MMACGVGFYPGCAGTGLVSCVPVAGVANRFHPERTHLFPDRGGFIFIAGENKVSGTSEGR